LAAVLPEQWETWAAAIAAQESTDSADFPGAACWVPVALELQFPVSNQELCCRAPSCPAQLFPAFQDLCRVPLYSAM